jgi:hypothetical protein
MITKLKALWASLPPLAKIAITLGVGAASGVIHHAFNQPCQSISCWKGYLLAAAHAGGITALAYVMDSPFAKGPASAPSTPPQV